jgi:hypothetical protein
LGPGVPGCDTLGVIEDWDTHNIWARLRQCGFPHW